ncbi:DUF397 domain-containing protein [Nocardia yunnanensis]|uniref:DUF397 domain-containing protein n=1 Tax=Nocardia yunnanensis TaxID=2382165 RepID=A0A386ZD80_9NOCA|nr:DUF397 domain-containing protein [Nocardia yunnanensis]AYF75133.1 DUF397 domain-containing protein [Nocardia yunnanensis]
MTDDLSGATWFKSSYSGDKADCVETAFLPGSLVGVRDSKDAVGSALIFSAREWETFIGGVVGGKYDC